MWYTQFMTTRKNEFSTDEYYHIYNRGNTKQPIFLDDDDRKRFVKLLYLCNSSKSMNFRDDIVKQKIDAFEFNRGTPLVSIGAWVLMPNHFHILLSPRGTLGENVSLFINKLSTAYSVYFNKKHERTGKLFEGTFKSVPSLENSQLKYNFSYIHLNPIKLIDSKWKGEGLRDAEKSLSFLGEYKWSSYQDYIGKKRVEAKIIDRKYFPDYFENTKAFNEEIFEWLKFKNI